MDDVLVIYGVLVQDDELVLDDELDQHGVLAQLQLYEEHHGVLQHALEQEELVRDEQSHDLQFHDGQVRDALTHGALSRVGQDHTREAHDIILHDQKGHRNQILRDENHDVHLKHELALRKMAYSEILPKYDSHRGELVHDGHGNHDMIGFQ